MARHTATTPEGRPHETSFRGEVIRRRVVRGFLLTELHYRAPSRSASHEHRLPFFVLLTQGGYSEHDAEGDCVLQRGAVRFHPGDYRHRDEISESDTRFLHVELIDESLSALPPQTRGRSLLGPPGGELSRLAIAVLAELRSDETANDLVLEGLALQLLGELTRPPDGPACPPWLRRVAERLREQFRESTSLAALAAEAGVHPVHLARSFRRYFRRSVGEELRRLRVEAASAALAREDCSIVEIAAASGFADQSHLARVFRRATGMSPAEYRAALTHGGASRVPRR
jgi:AraC family transcriptional regulator